MTGLIPDNKIDEIRLAADIVEVIGGYLTLKKRGRNYIALCPFHEEKTPSFSVSPDKQIFHCFGCGKGGNVFTFLMDHENLTFIEAVKVLADRYGLTLPRYERKTDSKTERLLYAHEVAADYYQKTLADRRYQSRMERYLYETRGLTRETVEEFRLGLAPDDWQGLVNYARTKDIKPEELAEAGLASRSEKTGEYYDRFRLRLMIPIFNLAGKIIAFGGRVLQKGDAAKYVNSPETALYNKSFVLYGLHASRPAIREKGTAILVEGYFDFLSLFQAGVTNVAAVSGTAFTPQQARLLARFVRKVYLFFDADSAGRSASMRSIEHFFNAGIEPWIITAPPKKDPDSFVREAGAEGVYQLLDKAADYLSFRFAGVDFSRLTVREKEEAAREITVLAEKIDQPLTREIFLGAAAEKLGIPARLLQPAGTAPADPAAIPERIRNINVIESELLSLFVNRPALIELAWKELSPDDFIGPGHGSLYALRIDAYRRTGDIDFQKLLEALPDQRLTSIMTFISTIDWQGIDLTGVVKEYRQMILNQKRDRQIGELRIRLEAAEKEGQHDLARKLTAEIKYLLEKRI